MIQADRTIPDSETDSRAELPLVSPAIKTVSEKSGAVSATRAEADEMKWSAWMKLAQGGDEHSYRQLLEAIGIAIQNYLASRLGMLEFTEDIVQESLIAIHQARHTYNPEKPFRPWLFAIVRHKTIDNLRKRSAREMHESPHPEMAGESEWHVDHGAEQFLEGQQLFRGLKEEFRQALVMTRIIGLTNGEAAKRTGISEVAMKVRVHRALKALKKELRLD